MGLLNMFKKKYKNELIELFDNNFNVMFIPTYPIFNNEDKIKLKYPYYNANKYTCIKEDYVFHHFDTQYYTKGMKEGKCVIVEINDLGSLIFTNHVNSDLFLILQRDYRDYTNFVFEGNRTDGYFKILEDGKIRRKIASHLKMEGIHNNPETRGKPCEYEITHQKIWKVDHKAKYMDDMIKGFNKKEIMKLFDYYVGLEYLDNSKINTIKIYRLEI